MKKTAILVAALILIPALTLGSVLFLLHRSDEPEDESAQVNFSETDKSGAEESSTENDCAHEKTYRGTRTEGADIPEGAVGLTVLLCETCKKELDVRPMWDYKYGENITLTYFENDDGGCTVIMMSVPRSLKLLELPEELNGLPVTALDTNQVISWLSATTTTICLPDTVNYISPRILRLCNNNFKTGEGNPYYRYVDKCLVDLRTGELVYSLEGCVIPDDGSVTKIGDCALRTNNYTLFIPASVSELTGSSFMGGGGDLILEVDEANETFAMIENCLVNVKTKTLVFGCPGYSIPRDGSVTKIDEYAFAYTYQPEEIFIPACIESIGASAFAMQPKKVVIEDLESWLKIDFADSGSSPFKIYEEAKAYDANGNRLTHITIPDEITEIKPYAFYGCRDLESVTFNGKETRIGDMAFSNTSLATLDLPSSVRELGKYAFAGTKLEKAELPASLTKIDTGCFNACPLESVTMENGGNGVYSIKENCIIEIAEKKLIYSCCDHIPSDGSVERIGEIAFQGNRKITRLVVPDTVKYIERKAFFHCNWLVSVSFPAGLEYIGEEAFMACDMLTDVVFDRECAAEIEFFAFNNCPLMNVELPGKTERIGAFAFDSWAPEKLVTPDSLKYLGSGAIRLNGLTELYIGRSLETLPNIISTSLRVIEVHPENKKYAVVNGCLIDKFAAELIEVCAGAVIPSDGSVKQLGDAFARRDIAEIRVPAAVETVGAGAFRSCTELKSVILEEGVKTVGERAFWGCASLEEITLPRSVESVGRQAFMNCTSLKRVYAYSGTVFAEDVFANIPEPEIIYLDKE
ncbi:MAG: leucine-rich repeat protein [Clostridia bacterium]|nr:leucine-rich repeat protein [Clostridia bacterium]